MDEEQIDQLSHVFSELVKNFEKVGKLQYKTYHVVEEIAEQLEQAAQDKLEHTDKQQATQNRGLQCCRLVHV